MTEFDKEEAFQFLKELEEYDHGEEIRRSNFGDNNKLREAIEKKDLSQLIDDKGRNPLHNAFTNKKHKYGIDKIKYLIDNKCDLHQKNNNMRGATPFLLAIKVCDLDMAKFLIEEQKCDVNRTNTITEGVLHYASGYNENLEVIKYLVEEKNMDIMHRTNNDNSYTAVTMAAMKNKNIEIIKYFLEDKKSDLFQQTEVGFTLLHFACMNNNFQGIELVKYLVEKKSSLDNTENRGDDTPLTTAAQMNHNLEVIKYLVEQKSDVNKKNMDHTPFECAAEEGKNLEIVKYFYEKTKFESEEKRKTSILQCLRNESFEIVKFLLDKEEIDFAKEEDRYGNNYFHYAIRFNPSGKVIKYLVEEKKCDVNTLNKDGQSVLMVACKAYHSSLSKVRYLVEEKGFDINAIEIDNTTKNSRLFCFFESVSAKSLNMEELMIFCFSNGANFDYKNEEDQETPRTILTKKFSDWRLPYKTREMIELFDRFENGTLWNLENHHLFSPSIRSKVFHFLVSFRIRTTQLFRSKFSKYLMHIIAGHLVNFTLWQINNDSSKKRKRNESK